MEYLLKDCRDLLLRLVNNHLTPKSHGRINHVFNHYSDPELLTKLYEPGGSFQSNLAKICKALNKMVEDGTIWCRICTSVKTLGDLQVQDCWTTLVLLLLEDWQCKTSSLRTKRLPCCSKRPCRIKKIYIMLPFLKFLRFRGKRHWKKLWWALVYQSSQKVNLNMKKKTWSSVLIENEIWVFQCSGERQLKQLDM